MTETRTWHETNSDDGTVTDTFHEFDTKAGGRVVLSPVDNGGMFIDITGNHILTHEEVEELSRLLLRSVLS